VKRIDLTLAMVAVLALAPAQAAQWEGPQAEAPETKDRLSPELMDQLVERPMWLLRHKGLAEAQKAFEELVAAAVKKDGKGSVREADLLESFGVQLYTAGDNDGPIRKAALAYLERAVPAYRAAFGPRHPEVAVALNSYADLALNLKDPKLRPAAISALEEALAIRTEKLGPDNAETRATVQYLERARKPLADALDEAAAAVDAAADETATATLGPNTVLAADDGGGLWKPDSSYSPLTDEFLGDLKQLEPGVEPPKRAVAAKYGLSVEALSEGISLLRAMDKSAYDRKRRDALRSRALAWLKLSSRAPVAVAFTASMLGRLNDDKCTPADIDLLLHDSRSRDADLWLIVTNCTTQDSLAAAIGRATTARPALLYLSMNWTHGDPATELAATDQLLQPAFLSQVGEERDRVHAEIARYKLSRLLDVGLWKEVVAFADSLDPRILALALRPEKGPLQTSIGGFALKENYYSEPRAADYAAALALAGRTPDARSALDAVAPRARLKELRACLDSGRDGCDVDTSRGVPASALVVDQFLEDPTADPYPLVETGASNSSSWSGSVTEVMCRLQTRPAEAQDCAAARALAARNSDLQADDQAFWAAIRRAGGAPLEAARARYAAMLPPAPKTAAPSSSWRASVDPAPVPFRERPIPTKGLSKAPPRADPTTVATLPKGFALVRAERSGKRAVAVSLSTRFDPNGEVSGGGYWVHLSDDGGKSWGPPLYTGLAEHFPYVVPQESRLPLLAGDRLQLEVEEALIDTATITYPPVGLHVRRKRSGIYLDIPLADLGKDSDGDGLTDIAARHLLLDEKGAGPTPFVVGRDRDCSASSPETLARLAILEKLFEVEAQALIEPPDKKALIGDWRRIQPSGKPPIFLRGNPDEWRCITLDRPMIVYSEADQERLRKFSPDFQLITLPPIRWNRAHTRGFVSWSMGWTGGTYRLVRTAHGWDLQSISSWIT